MSPALVKEHPCLRGRMWGRCQDCPSGCLQCVEWTRPSGLRAHFTDVNRKLRQADIQRCPLALAAPGPPRRASHPILYFSVLNFLFWWISLLVLFFFLNKEAEVSTDPRGPSAAIITNKLVQSPWSPGVAETPLRGTATPPTHTHPQPSSQGNPIVSSSLWYKDTRWDHSSHGHTDRLK